MARIGVCKRPSSPSSVIGDIRVIRGSPRGGAQSCCHSLVVSPISADWPSRRERTLFCPGSARHRFCRRVKQEQKKGPPPGRIPQGRALVDTWRDGQALPVPVASFTTHILAVRARISTPKSGQAAAGAWRPASTDQENQTPVLCPPSAEGDEEAETRGDLTRRGKARKEPRPIAPTPWHEEWVSYSIR